MRYQARLDRQLRIPDWNQNSLARAQVGVVGDNGFLTPLFLLAAAALGLNHLRLIGPRPKERFIALAKKLNPEWQLVHFEGYYTHPFCQEAFRSCNLVVDLGGYGLADKILLEHAFHNDSRVLLGRTWRHGREQGFKIFTYHKGREWLEVQEVLAPVNLPGKADPTDGVLDIIAAGLILEEAKNVLAGRRVSPEMLTYQRHCPDLPGRQPAIGIVGAGALGNFVGLGLALSGFQDLTIIDPDVIEVTNLNRQVFFAGAVGAEKAHTLAARLNHWFGTKAVGVKEYFRPGSDLAGFDIVFDCVDNFASRIVLSEACAAAGKILISGGASSAAGQVVAYSPRQQPQTPAALLGLYDIVASRPPESPTRQRTACIYEPDPAVIMTNQIIAGFMVEAGRKVLAGQESPPLFYDAKAGQRFSMAS